MYDLSLLNINISITNNTLLTEPTFYVTTPGRGCCRYAHPLAGCTLLWAVTVALVLVSSVLHHSTTSNEPQEDEHVEKRIDNATKIAKRKKRKRTRAKSKIS